MPEPQVTIETVLEETRWLRSLARRLVGEAEADDVVQSVWLRFIRKPPRDLSNIRPWLVRVAKNLVRRESLREMDEVPPGASSRFPMPDRVAEVSELRGFLEEALMNLPEVQRQIVLLHDLEGWKHREIAERIGLPSGTVRSHLHFARKALRIALRRVPGVPEMMRAAQ